MHAFPPPLSASRELDSDEDNRVGIEMIYCVRLQVTGWSLPMTSSPDPRLTLSTEADPRWAGAPSPWRVPSLPVHNVCTVPRTYLAKYMTFRQWCLLCSSCVNQTRRSGLGRIPATHLASPTFFFARSPLPHPCIARPHFHSSPCRAPLIPCPLFPSN